jgi:di/tricarboxylate transporter
MMVLILLLAVGVVVLYITEWISIELTSIGVIAVLLLLFQIFPVQGPDGAPALGPEQLLRGFANPALITVMALLVVGEGLVRTGALDGLAQALSHPRLSPRDSLVVVLITVALLSAFLNNTPIVLIFMPIIQTLARQANLANSRAMIPLSYAAVLGGMTTLVGSSTNLLVSSALIEQGLPGFTFFEFTPLALLLVLPGLAYTTLALPRLLPDRVAVEEDRVGGGRQYISQLVVPDDSPLNGERAVAGVFRSLPNITVRMVLRGGRAIMPPFDDTVLHAGDLLVLAATRSALTEAAAGHPGLFHPPRSYGLDRARDRLRDMGTEETRDDTDGSTEHVLIEIMVNPSSRLIGRTVAQTGFLQQYRSIITGIQRRARMIRAKMVDIHLEAGDILLVLGREEDVNRLRQDRDFVVLSGTKGLLPRRRHAGAAQLIFLGAVGSAALGLLPITVAAVVAATAMVATRALNLRQAGRAIDRKILLVVVAALALGEALKGTGGAEFVAHGLIDLLGDVGPAVILSVFFLVVALFTNILTNNACAVLFTPIGVGLARELGVDPHVFAVTVVLAANCSFASPVGYQTNLLVMGPGQYQFGDFVRAGLPLLVLLWVVFSIAAPMVFSL